MKTLALVAFLGLLVMSSSCFDVMAKDVVRIVVPTGSSPSWTLQHKEYSSAIKKTHVGVDVFGANTTKGGDPVYPFADGIVVSTCTGRRTSSCSPDFGNAIMIKHLGIGKNGSDLFSIYLHLEKAPQLSSGAKVVGGATQIGSIGKTGAANNAYHVHFEIRYFSTWLFSKWGNIYCPGDCTTSRDIATYWEDPQNIDLSSTPQDHSLIRAQGNPDVFWLQNGKRYHIADQATLERMVGTPGWGWNLVSQFPSAVVNRFPRGPEFIPLNSLSNGLLIREQGTDPVFLMENGKRRWITTLKEFNNRRLSFNDVIAVSNVIIGSIPEGLNIPPPTLKTDRVENDLFVFSRTRPSNARQGETITVTVELTAKRYLDHAALTEEFGAGLKLVRSSCATCPTSNITRVISALAPGKKLTETYQLRLEQASSNLTISGWGRGLPSNAASRMMSLPSTISTAQVGFSAGLCIFSACFGQTPNSDLARFASEPNQDTISVVTIPSDQLGLDVKLAPTESYYFELPIEEYFDPNANCVLEDTEYLSVYDYWVKGLQLPAFYYPNSVDDLKLLEFAKYWVTARTMGNCSTNRASRAPVITDSSSDMPGNTIVVNGAADWELYFSDLDGDVTWVRFLAQDGSIDAEWDPDVRNQTTGTIHVRTTCYEVGNFYQVAILFDSAGNTSNEFGYNIMCQDIMNSNVFLLNDISLSINKVIAKPDKQGYLFSLYGSGIQQTQVQVYSLSGQVIYDSGFDNSASLHWDLSTTRGQCVANGTYFYIVTIKNHSGEIKRSEVKKLMVMR